MAYSVDWTTKVITVPTSDLTLVSGTHYQLQMSAFLGEIRRLEAGFTDGLWAPQILDHTNPKLDFAGTDYAGFDEVFNGYTLQFTGVATRVDLIGSNNNIIDVLIPTGVSIVSGNSQGLQLVSTGSGLSAEQDTKLSNVNAQVDANLTTIEGSMSHAMMTRLIFSMLCTEVVNAETGTVTFKSADGTKNRVTVDADEYGNRSNPMWDMTP